MSHVFIISDGSGTTAEQVLTAALTQFEHTQVTIERRPKVRTNEQIRKVVREAVQHNGIIVHTLVSDDLRGVILQQGRLHNIETVDLMGPLLARLSQHFGNSPIETPGLFQELNKEYFRRIDAMEFAINHDDGLRIHELPRAEIVLLGVSRTFKTPLSIYLAFKGWYVANVPIILGAEPEEEVFQVPPERVFCLNTNPRKLALLRRSRETQWGGNTGEYADQEYIRLELMHARSIFNREPKWRILEVTNKPIEEIASEVISLIEHPDVTD